MTYNKDDIAKYVKKRRRDFIFKIVCSLLFVLISSLVIALFPEMTVIFVCVVIIIISVFYAIKTLKRYQPVLLFSEELQGENVKEHEFVVTNRRLSFGGRRSFSRFKPVAYSSQRSRTKPPTSAIVYIKLPCGDVTYLDGLSGAQTDIYEIGDTLYKYPGTRYPIILNREVKAQPCPICGTANKASEEKCITCGLKTR